MPTQLIQFDFCWNSTIPPITIRIQRLLRLPLERSSFIWASAFKFASDFIHNSSATANFIIVHAPIHFIHTSGRRLSARTRSVLVSFPKSLGHQKRNIAPHDHRTSVSVCLASLRSDRRARLENYRAIRAGYEWTRTHENIFRKFRSSLIAGRQQPATVNWTYIQAEVQYTYLYTYIEIY